MPTTVMLVEDDPGLQEVLSDILELEGYRVIVARDGVDALERLVTVSPALILLDLMMPRMDGFAFADALRRRGLRPAIPIVVVTADGRAEQKAAQMQAEGYLEKPFSMPELLDVVDRLAGR